MSTTAKPRQTAAHPTRTAPAEPATDYTPVTLDIASDDTIAGGGATSPRSQARATE